MNLKQITDNGKYPAFSRMTFDSKKEQIDTVDYIQAMAASAGVDIDHWNIIKVFGVGRGNKLIVDRREINKRLFARIAEDKKNQAENPLKALDESIFKDLPVPRIVKNASVEDRLKDDKAKAESKMRSALFTAKTQLANVVQAERQLMAMRGQHMDIPDQVRRIQAGGFWQFSHVDGSRLFFKTIQEVIVRHFSRRPSVDLTVNFGKFYAFIDMNHGTEICLRPLSNNILVGGDILHPHGMLDGVCWGAAHERAYDMLRTMDYVGVMQLLANLLKDYNPHGPFAGIYSFYRVRMYQAANEMKSKGSTNAEIEAFLKNANIEQHDIKIYLEQGFKDNMKEQLDRLVQRHEDGDDCEDDYDNDSNYHDEMEDLDDPF